ncbi:MAG: carbohydrate binding domain-containing protein [Xanthomonadaceae bacterium]|nr:carbohydrate binding domain-containing protein [Xanthomonadaceae bacterium]
MSSGAVQFVQQRISLEKGQRYLISIWIKGVVEGPVELMLRKRGKPYTTYASKALRIGKEWKRYEFDITSGVDDSWAMFMIRLTGRGEVWLDDASVHRISGMAVKPPQEGNLIANGSFEAGIDRWAVQVREAAGYRHGVPITFADIRPTIVAGKMPHGSHALQVDMPRHARVRLTTPPFEISPGNPYTMSLWLKTNNPRSVSISLKDVSHGARPLESKRFAVSNEWKHYYHTIEIPPSAGEQYVFLMESDGEGELLVDAVQVGAGGSGEFSPSRQVELGFARSGEAPLFAKGSPVSLELCMALHEQSEMNYSLSVSTTDFYDIERELLAREIAGGMPGVQWLRMHPPLATKWFVVEPEQGRFEFIDEPIHYAKSQGFHILGSLDSTPRWASSAPGEMQSESSHGFRAYPPRAIADWENYVSRIVSHYKGVIDHWEVWNEPDSGGFLKLPGLAIGDKKPEVYVELVKTAYTAAKRANPGSVIVAGVGTGHPPIRWVEKIVEHGVLDYLDVLSFHYYTDGRPGDVHDVPARERVREIHALVDKSGKDGLRYWESESGLALNICTGRPAGNSPEYCAEADEAVAFVLRNYFEWISSGVERWFFYHMFFPDRTDRDEFAGFFTWDRSPTPLAIGYAVASHLLSGMKYIESFEVSKDVAGITFADDEKIIKAYWIKDWSATSRKTISVQPETGSQRVRLIDAMGVEKAMFEPGEMITMEVGRVPVYMIENLEPNSAISQ